MKSYIIWMRIGRILVTIDRLLCAGFCLIAVAVEGKTVNDGECLFGATSSTCSVLKFTSLVALLISLALVAADVVFNRITSINKRKGLHESDNSKVVS